MTAARPGLLFVVSAPSGAGKTSLVAALLAQLPGITVCVSHTTRSPRTKEVDGVNYHFIDRATFESMITEGAFLEYASVFDNYYGTSIKSVHAALDSGQDLILEIDWQGAAQIRQLLPDALSIFILPPDLATLEQRLRARGQDDDTVIRGRLSKAVEEMSHWSEFDFLVVNDDFARATVDMVSIVRSERLRRAPQQSVLAGQLAALEGLGLDTPSSP